MLSASVTFIKSNPIRNSIIRRPCALNDIFIGHKNLSLITSRRSATYVTENLVIQQCPAVESQCIKARSVVIGLPIRIIARTLLFPKYTFDDFVSLRQTLRHKYARNRFGSSYIWRLWLLFDIEGLKRTETLINTGSDEDVLKLREIHLDAYRLIILVGALLAQSAIAAHSLPGLAETTYYARGIFVLSLVASLLAIFFTYIQHHRLHFVQHPTDLRALLSNGQQYTDSSSKTAIQSSMVTYHLLQIPYELTGTAITLFLIGLGVYLGSAWTNDVCLNVKNGKTVGNFSVFVAFLAGIVTGCIVFGFMDGRRIAEHEKAKQRLDGYLRSIGPSRPGSDVQIHCSGPN